jgi:uncharacterized protein (TIGR02646 family)
MRTIQKGPEPATLIQHRQQEHANYDNYADKDDLRQALVAEQHAVCCYCQSRIRATSDGMKIEHWQSQASFPALQLEYRNLLGSCPGGEGRRREDQHCDTSKGNVDLCFSVCDAAHPIERQIRFLGDGRIQSDDGAVNDALNKVLNLNWERLVANRRATLEAFKQRLQRGHKLDPTRELPKWDASQPGDLPEFAQVIVYWLNKRLKRATT